jgi:alcohol dehydrogenase class IV
VAVFLSLPQVARFNFEAKSQDLQNGVSRKRLCKSFDILFNAFSVDSLEGFVSSLDDIRSVFGFSSSLRDYGIERESLSMIARKSLSRGRSDNNPRIITARDILKFLEAIY